MPGNRRLAVRDLRSYAQHTSLGLVAGFLLILFLVGEGLIYWLYGQPAALMGLLCISLGLLPLILIAFSMLVIDWMVKRAQRE